MRFLLGGVVARGAVPVPDTRPGRLWMRAVEASSTRRSSVVRCDRDPGRPRQSMPVTPFERWRRAAARWPAYALNGASAALGIGLVHALFALLGGPVAVASAGAGAICTSLGDLPDTTGRNARRVIGAAVASLLAGFVVTLLEPHPAWLGVAVAV